MQPRAPLSGHRHRAHRANPHGALGRDAQMSALSLDPVEPRRKLVEPLHDIAASRPPSPMRSRQRAQRAPLARPRPTSHHHWRPRLKRGGPSMRGGVSSHEPSVRRGKRPAWNRFAVEAHARNERREVAAVALGEVRGEICRDTGGSVARVAEMLWRVASRARAGPKLTAG